MLGIVGNGCSILFSILVSIRVSILVMANPPEGLLGPELLGFLLFEDGPFSPEGDAGRETRGAGVAAINGGWVVRVGGGDAIGWASGMGCGWPFSFEDLFLGATRPRWARDASLGVPS